VRERIKDWGAGLCAALGKRLVELTGDAGPDARALLAADVIIATPEKWDGISRAWATRGYVQRVRLLVIDEIHLLGADRRAPRPAPLRRARRRRRTGGAARMRPHARMCRVVPARSACLWAAHGGAGLGGVSGAPARRGPILEVIVSRMRYIAAQTAQPIRFVGLSTALANAADLAAWLGIGPQVPAFSR